MRTILSITLLQGCALGASGPYSGEVDGLDAVVGLTLDSGEGRLYVSGGDMTRDSHTRWFDIATEARGFVGEADGWTVTADFFAGGFSGTLTDPGGASWAFAAEPPLSDVDGVYAAEEGDCLAGAVVWDGGAELQGVVCVGGLRARVEPVGGIVLEDGGLRVRAGDGEPFVMRPVVP